MSTSGWRKAVCKRGHVGAPRNAIGACTLCIKHNKRERYANDPERYKQAATAYAKANPDAHRDQQRAQRLGRPVSEIRAVIAACNGVCEACGKALTHKTMCIDHDHATGEIRGVLCRFCNALEGILAKHSDRIDAVLAYLARKTVPEASP